MVILGSKLYKVQSRPLRALDQGRFGLVAGLLLPPAQGGILGRRQVRVHDPDCVVELDVGATVLEQPVAVRTSITDPTIITVGPGATLVVNNVPTYVDTIVTVISTVIGTRTHTYTINRSGSGITSTTIRTNRPGFPSSTSFRELVPGSIIHSQLSGTPLVALSFDSRPVLV
ncbi:hypothetical protein BKCO1_7000169 [Neofusicoccum parvum]|nr:hypothetical protein BKCO1_7000169 [Neofusicoccum parvum]